LDCSLQYRQPQTLSCRTWHHALEKFKGFRLGLFFRLGLGLRFGFSFSF
jgi:hypothetical protein